MIKNEEGRKKMKKGKEKKSLLFILKLLLATLRDTTLLTKGTTSRSLLLQPLDLCSLSPVVHQKRVKKSKTTKNFEEKRDKQTSASHGKHDRHRPPHASPSWEPSEASSCHPHDQSAFCFKRKKKSDKQTTKKNQSITFSKSQKKVKDEHGKTRLFLQRRG